jgi:Cytochrome P460
MASERPHRSWVLHGQLVGEPLAYSHRPRVFPGRWVRSEVHCNGAKGPREKSNETDRVSVGWNCDADRSCDLHGPRAPIFATDIPAGYRDWKLISVAHEEGNLHSFAAVLGNDTAIQAYREGKVSFPDGAIIAALHYRHVPSEENNKVFGQAQSFVPGTPTNIQFMVKESKKYASTGGWGFAHFQDGKPSSDEAFMKTCFPCHNQVKARDLVFTRYAK